MKALVLHAIDGRLRIRVVEIKNDPHRAREICEALENVLGIECASANVVTGSITINYDPRGTTAAAVWRTLTGLFEVELLPPPSSAARVSPIPLADIGHRVAQAILTRAAEVALKRAFLAFM